MARQVSAFVPSPIAERIDEIRTRWDPEMARRIAAHITLVYDLDDECSVANTARDPIRVRLTDARCWGSPEGGIYLGVEDVQGDIGRIRNALGVAEPAAIPYVPHVTLLHPRTVEPVRLADAWTELEGWNMDVTVTITEIAVVSGGRG